MVLVTVTLMFAVSPFTALYVHQVIVDLIKLTSDSDKINIIHHVPLTFSNAGVSISLFIIHIFSIVTFMQYVDEILSNENHNTILPIVQAVISLLSIIMGVILLAIILSIRENSSDSLQSANNRTTNNNQGNFNSNPQLTSTTNGNSTLECDLPAAVISVNIIYIGCYYFPYMALAFFNSPILTTIIYLTLVVLYMCVYLICLGTWRLFELIKKAKEKCGNTEEAQQNSKTKKLKRKECAKLFHALLYPCMMWAIAFSFIIFIFVIIFVITSGGFDDFEELNTLAPSLLIAGVSLILLKPAYNTVTNKMKSKDGETENPVQQQTLEQQDQRRT